MRLARGRLNTRVEIQRREITIDPTYGTRIEGPWTTVARPWVEWQDVLPSRAESVAEGVEIARRPARLRMDFRTDVTGDMRVVRSGAAYKIVAGPAELGRRDATEIMVEEISTEGQDA